MAGVIATAFRCLTILFNALFSVHTPVLSGNVELLEEKRYICLSSDKDNVNALLTAASLLLESFCKLIFL